MYFISFFIYLQQFFEEKILICIDKLKKAFQNIKNFRINNKF